MPLSATLRAQIEIKLRAFEGVADFLYLDSKGKVTIGVGDLVALRDDVKGIPLSSDGGPATKDATDAEKLAEYDRVKTLLGNKSLRYYERTAKLKVKQSYIQKKVDHHIDYFYDRLCANYTAAAGYPTDFDAMPEAVKLALFDMAFNLGMTGLLNKFPSFNKALKTSDYAEAKKQGRRPDVQADRNDYVAALFDPLIAAQAAAVKARAVAPAFASPVMPGLR